MFFLIYYHLYSYRFIHIDFLAVLLACAISIDFILALCRICVGDGLVLCLPCVVDALVMF